MTVAVYDKGKVLETAQPVSSIGCGRLGLVPRRRSRRGKGHDYSMTIVAVDANGNQVDRSILVRVERPKTPVA